MLQGTKKLFPTDYKKFAEAMIEAAETDQLPISLQLDNASDFMFKDVQDMFRDFQNDTGLDIVGSMFLCEECGRLHLLIHVDYPEEKEETILQ